MVNAARKYNSPARAQQALETRHSILSAARTLFLNRGFGATRMEEIASTAGCAVPTIFAAFKSKAGILAALAEHASFGPDYEALVERQREVTDPEERLRSAARIARCVFQSEHAELDALLGGAAIVSTEIAAKEREREAQRLERQQPVVDLIVGSGRLRGGLSADRARDILWTQTSREVFRLLVLTRGWSLSRYEGWLGQMLIEQLLDPQE